MLSTILKLFGFKIIYVCEWGEYDSRYDAIDRMMTRPIHPQMSTAPPWSRMKIVKNQRR